MFNSNTLMILYYDTWPNVSMPRGIKIIIIYIYIYIILEYSKKILQFSSLKFVLEEKGKLKILAFPKII